MTAREQADELKARVEWHAKEIADSPPEPAATVVARRLAALWKNGEASAHVVVKWVKGDVTQFQILIRRPDGSLEDPTVARL